MKILTLIVLLFSFNSYASEVEVNCSNDDNSKTIVINHDINDSAAQFSVKDSQGQVLGSGEFDSIQSGKDGFLNLFFVGYESEAGVVGVALLGVEKESFEEIENGTYQGKSDLTVEYSETGYIDGSTLDCTVKIEKK